MSYKKRLIISSGKKVFRITLDSDSLLDVILEKNRTVSEVTYMKGSKYVEGSTERSYSKTYSFLELPEKYIEVLKESGLLS